MLVVVEGQQGQAAAAGDHARDGGVDDHRCHPRVRLGAGPEEIARCRGDRTARRDHHDGARLREAVQGRPHPRPEVREGLVVGVIVLAGRPARGGCLEPGLELRAVRLPLEGFRLGGEDGEMVHLVPPLVAGRRHPPPGRLGRDLGGTPLAKHRPVHQPVGLQVGQRLTHDRGLSLSGVGEHVVVGLTPRRLAVPDEEYDAHDREARRSIDGRITGVPTRREEQMLRAGVLITALLLALAACESEEPAKRCRTGHDRHRERPRAALRGRPPRRPGDRGRPVLRRRAHRS